MVVRRILVPSTPGQDMSLPLKAAFHLSRRLGAHIRLLYVRGDPTILFDAMPEAAMTAGVTMREIEAEDVQAAITTKSAFSASCLAAGIQSQGRPVALNTPFATWVEQIGEIEPLVALVGRVSDLIVVERPNAGSPRSERIFDAAVFSSGRPTLVVSEGIPDDLLRHVVIAWNDSLEVARLVGHALSLLHAADRVSIMTAGSERNAETQFDDLHDYLTVHGINAHALGTAGPEGSDGAALLAGAAKGNASMIMMGAYTHSRLRQFLLGGATSHVLKHASIPVLMEH